ncbi:MAG: hypothetical protein IPN88_04555 [Bacteroidetes bacterium]|nr:hypothetical protein [Bacteroidota bacterium]
MKRWKHNALETGSQLIIASKGLKNKSRKFWVIHSPELLYPGQLACIVNCLILAFRNVPLTIS